MKYQIFEEFNCLPSMRGIDIVDPEQHAASYQTKTTFTTPSENPQVFLMFCSYNVDVTVPLWLSCVTRGSLLYELLNENNFMNI